MITHNLHEWAAEALGGALAGTSGVTTCNPGSGPIVATAANEIDTDNESSDPDTEWDLLQLRAWCQAGSCGSADTASASVTNLAGEVDDPDNSPQITVTGNLWAENGAWVSGNVAPPGGWSISVTADDPGGVCTLDSFLTPAGGTEAQAALSDTANNVTASPTSATGIPVSTVYDSDTPCGGSSRSFTWSPNLSGVANGIYDLHVQASNPAGGLTDQSITISVDNDPPPAVTGLKATTSAMGPSGWSSSPDFNLSWTAAADITGPQSPITTTALTECDPDGTGCNTSQQATPAQTGTLDLPPGAAAGDYQGFVWEIDQAGNQGAQTAVDLPYDPNQPAAPALTPDWNGPVGGSQAATVPEKITAAAGGPSGIYGYQVTADTQPTGTWQQVNSTGTYDLSTLPDGLHTLYARAFSGAGVPGPLSQTTVDLEQNGPGLTVAASPTIPPDGQPAGPVTFTLDCTDRPDPGCASVAYTVDNATPVTVPGDTAMVTIAGAGAHTLTAYSTDTAGNRSGTTTASFTVLAPGQTPSPSAPPVFTVAPAPATTHTVAPYRPPVIVTGLDTGNFINVTTKYLTIRPLPPRPQRPASITVTYAQHAKIEAVTRTSCRRGRCRLRVPLKELANGPTRVTISVRCQHGKACGRRAFTAQARVRCPDWLCGWTVPPVRDQVVVIGAHLAHAAVSTWFQTGTYTPRVPLTKDVTWAEYEDAANLLYLKVQYWNQQYDDGKTQFNRGAQPFGPFSGPQLLLSQDSQETPQFASEWASHSSCNFVCSLQIMGLIAFPEEDIAADLATTAFEAGDELIPETETVLQDAAQKAVKEVGEGKGAVYGTKVHKALENIVKGLGRDDLHTEVSYKDGRVMDRPGVKGSVKLDVVEGPKNKPIAIWDLKTGSATLREARIKQIRDNLPDGFKDIPVKEFRP